MRDASERMKSHGSAQGGARLSREQNSLTLSHGGDEPDAKFEGISIVRRRRIFENLLIISRFY